MLLVWTDLFFVDTLAVPFYNLWKSSLSKVICVWAVISFICSDLISANLGYSSLFLNFTEHSDSVTSRLLSLCSEFITAKSFCRGWGSSLCSVFSIVVKIVSAQLDDKEEELIIVSIVEDGSLLIWLVLRRFCYFFSIFLNL